MGIDTDARAAAIRIDKIIEDLRIYRNTGNKPNWAKVKIGDIIVNLQSTRNLIGAVASRIEQGE